MPGRKLLLHNAGPITGWPRHTTTNRGSFWFPVPRPYVSHEPKLGRTGCVSPQVIISSDGSWFGTFVYIERITHKSSACRATCGKISLTGSPDWPWRVKRNGDIIRPAVARSVLRLAVGGRWPL